MCIRLRDLDGTTRSLRGVESEKEELSTLTVMLQKSIEVKQQKPEPRVQEIDEKAERTKPQLHLEGVAGGADTHPTTVFRDFLRRNRELWSCWG